MSITIVSEGGVLRVVSCDSAIPEGVEMELLTPDEIERRVEERMWLAISPETRSDMLLQSGSKSYEDWMNEDVWDRSAVQESSAASLPLHEFKP